MSLIKTIILGVVQGLTEFLPVSSSGHLVICQRLFGLESAGVTLEVLLHFGTLLAVFWVFWRDFLDLLKFPRDAVQRRFLLLLILGCIPTALIGFFLGDFIESIFHSLLLTGAALIVTGGILKLLTLLPEGSKDVTAMRPIDALWIGLLQGIAVIPGISRSGSTITAALWRGLERATAVRYSFMLAAPVILGATLLEIKEMFSAGIEKTLLLDYAAGTVTAFICGVLAIRLFIRLLQQKKFHYFAYYCWALGAAAIAAYYFY
ncbi:MAG TPA: undecaprenyl-diphosphate phosphatase [Bacillota bacterium]|mgnify:CR=1 FL=1|nr:undecaprenyl-diphosphate phosphatase [Bacillota bacterium]